MGGKMGQLVMSLPPLVPARKRGKKNTPTQFKGEFGGANGLPLKTRLKKVLKIF